MNSEIELDELLADRCKTIEVDIPSEWYKKIPEWDTIEPGDKVTIEWTGEILKGVVDVGYIFQLPMCDEDYSMLDFFVHIPNPDNSSGIGDAPQVFVHLITLLQSELVETIKKVTLPQ